MSNNIVEAIDRISKSLGGNAASNNATEAIDKLSVALNEKLKGAEYDLSWTQIVNDIQAGDFSRYAVGDILTCSYKGEDGTIYDNPLRIVDIREEEFEDGDTRKGMWLQQKYATADAVQFSHPRALVALPEGLAAGTYYIACAYKVSNYFTSGSGIQFTTTIDIPAGGRIAPTLSGSYANFNESMGLISYAADGKTVLENLTVTKGTSGTLLGTTGANANSRSENVNDIYEVQYGSNNFEISAARQWLNSDKKAGEWWTPQDKWDVAPANLNNIDGYLSKLPKSLVAALRPISTVTVGNTAVYSNAEAETFDLVTMPSKEQMYIAKQSNNEGAAFSYWQELNGTDTPYQNGSYNQSTGSIEPTYDELKIGSVNKPETPSTIWLRSARVGSPSGVWYVHLNGIVSYAGACYQLRLLPIMFIC